jgi:hypothetical protein
MSKKRGGLPGGGLGGGSMGPNMGMMKQLQKMQQDMADAQKALETETTEVTRGPITIVITGHQRVQSVTINPAGIDTSDEEWLTDLQDLITIAINEAIIASQTMAAQRMESITGGLGGIPGLGDMFGG